VSGGSSKRPDACETELPIGSIKGAKPPTVTHPPLIGDFINSIGQKLPRQILKDIPKAAEHGQQGQMSRARLLRTCCRSGAAANFDAIIGLCNCSAWI
jgi:hypothetical protein